MCPNLLLKIFPESRPKWNFIESIPGEHPGARPDVVLEVSGVGVAVLPEVGPEPVLLVAGKVALVTLPVDEEHDAVAVSFMLDPILIEIKQQKNFSTAHAKKLKKRSPGARHNTWIRSCLATDVRCTHMAVST
jgi:hypothetical protein